MHLNYDCLRDVLIVLQKLLDVRHEGNGVFSFSVVSIDDLMADPDITGYPVEDVFYCIHNLSQADYIDAQILHSGSYAHQCCVSDITYAGHMFLRNISDATIWSTLKKKLGPGIDAALPVVFDLAGKLIAEKIGL